MADNVLKIGALVDVEAIESGMGQAASIVDTATGRMKIDFDKLADSSKQSFDKTKEEAAAADADFSRFGKGGIFAFEELQKELIEAVKRLAELRAEMLATNDVAEKQRLAPELKQAQAEYTSLRTQMRGLTLEMREATEKAALLGDAVGVRIPAELVRLLARMPEVQAALASVFEVGIIFAFVREIAEALSSWDDFREKVDSMLEPIARLEGNLLHMVGIIGDVSAAGAKADAAGEAYATKQADLAGKVLEKYFELNNTHLQGAALASAESSQRQTLDQLAISGLDAQISKLRELVEEHHREKDMVQLATVEAERDHDLRMKLVDDEIGKRKTLLASLDEGDRNTSARIGAEKTVSDASIAFEEQTAKERLALDQITLDQEIAQLLAAENEKYEAEKGAIAKRRALALSEQAATGKPAGPALTGLEGQSEALEVSHQARLDGITTAGQQARQKSDDAAASARVQGAQRIADAEVALEQDSAKRLLATRQISIAEETAALESAENKRYAAEKAAQAQRLAIANELPERNKAEIISINAEIEAAAIQHQARLQSIAAEGATQQLEETRRRLNEELRASEDSANRELAAAREADNHKLAMHQESLSQWEAADLAAINRWYEEQKAVLDKELAAAKLIFGQNSVEYQKMLDKENALDHQREAEIEKTNDKVEQQYQQMFTRIMQPFNTFLTSVISGQQTLAQSWNRLLSGMVSRFISSILEMAEQELVGLALHKATALSEQETAAKVAASNTYASVSAVPIIGPVLAPIAAGAAFAAVLAFDKGGIVPDDALAVVHRKEMVLPPDLSTGMQDMIHGGRGGGSQSSEGGGGDTYHMHMHMPPITAMDSTDMVGQLKKVAPQMTKTMLRSLRGGHGSLKGLL